MEGKEEIKINDERIMLKVLHEEKIVNEKSSHHENEQELHGFYFSESQTR